MKEQIKAFTIGEMTDLVATKVEEERKRILKIIDEIDLGFGDFDLLKEKINEKV